MDLTGLHWTSARVFGYWQPAASTSSDPNIFYDRGHGVGISMEKLLGNSGISGVQTNLTIGNTPAYNYNLPAQPPSPSVFPIPTKQESPFVSWTSWINKSFQDKQGYVRANPSFGLTCFSVKRYLDDPTLPESGSTGYGYTFDLMTIPVRSYWTSILRYDQYRATDLAHLNTTYTFTVGQALDLHLPNSGRIRISFDYQLVGQRETTPTHRFILGFWPIW